MSRATEARTATLQRAVLRRIGRQGDMPIRVRSATLYALIRAAGLDWSQHDGDETTHRDVCPVSLEAICVLGGGRFHA